MAYDTKPTPEYVTRFAEERATFWRPHIELCDRFYNMVTLQGDGRPTNSSMQQGDNDKPPMLSMGIPSVLVGKNMSIVGTPPGYKINLKDESPATKKKVETVLEPWVNVSMDVSQAEMPVRRMALQDMFIYGVGFRSLTLLPRLWASDRYKSMTSELLKLTKQQGYAQNGDMPRLESERSALQNKITMYERSPGNFPIRQVHHDARSVLPLIEGDHPWPEVVVATQMSAVEVAARYGMDAVPEMYKQQPSFADKVKDRLMRLVGRNDGEQLCTVYTYFNHYFYSCVVAAHSSNSSSIGSVVDAKEIHTWEHGLGENPIIPFEGELFPVGTAGMRWMSSLFPFESALKALDVLLSDHYYHHRRFTRSQIMLFLNAAARRAAAEEAKAFGRDVESMDFSPDQTYIKMFEGEDAKPAPLSQMGAQSNWLVEMLRQYIGEIVLNPAEMGKLVGVINAAGISIALQESKSRLSVITKEMKKADTKAARLAIKSVDGFSQGNYTTEDKIYVHLAKGGQVGVGPKDVEGIETQVEPVYADMLPMDENRKLSNAQMKVGVLGYSRETVMSQDLGTENPQMERMRRYREDYDDMLFQAAAEQRVQMIVQMSNQGMATPAASEIADMLLQQGMPPELMDIAQQIGLLQPFELTAPQMPARPALGPGTEMGSMGAASQGMANTRRAGLLPNAYDVEGGYNTEAALFG